jgi:hypothetical protein
MKDNEYIEKSAAKVEDNSSREKKTPSSGKLKTGAFNQILNGEFLTKDFVLDNLNYIFFIFLLLLLLVAKGYYVKQVIEEANEAQIQLDQNTADFIEAKTTIESITERNLLVFKLQKRELKESQKATKVIRIKKEKSE